MEKRSKVRTQNNDTEIDNSLFDYKEWRVAAGRQHTAPGAVLANRLGHRVPGRPVLGERFETGRAVFRFSLHREQRPLLLERLNVNGVLDLDSPAGLRGLPVMGTLVATGADDAVVRSARQAASGRTDALLGITRVGDVLVARYLGSSTQQARKLFMHIWRTIRPLVHGRQACAPRIWAT